MSAGAARHHRVLVVSGDHCGWELDLAEPAVGRRVGSLVIAEPEVGLCCPADLGLARPGRHRRRPRSARPRAAIASPVVRGEELVELLAVGIIERPWIALNPRSEQYQPADPSRASERQPDRSATTAAVPDHLADLAGDHQGPVNRGRRGCCPCRDADRCGGWRAPCSGLRGADGETCTQATCRPAGACNPPGSHLPDLQVLPYVWQ